MVRSVLVAASVLSWALSLPARAVGAEWGPGGFLSGGSAGVGTYFGFVWEASAEVVVADRLALGAKAVYVPGWGGGSGEAAILPSVSIGTRRSLPSAAYFTFSYVAGSSGDAFAGTLGLGYERTLLDRMRVFGEAGVFGGFSEEGGGAVLPYLLVGVRWRF
jgi:hypothetical protein